MRILFSAQNFLNEAGGAEFCAQNLLKSLAKKHEVHVLSRGKRGDYIWEGVRVHEIRCPNSIPYIHLRWKRHLDSLKIKPDLFITQLNAAAPTVAWAKKQGIPAIFYVHSFEHFCQESFDGKDVLGCGQRCHACGGLRRMIRSPAYKLLQRMNKKAILDADMVISPSRYMAELVRHYTGRVCDVVPNPLDLERTRTKERGDGVLFVNPWRHKGADLVAKLIRLLPERRFIIAGVLEKGFEHLKDGKNVEYLGRVGDMREAYGKAKVLIAPSTQADNFPSVILEAMANGMPCITSDAAGVSEAGGDASIKIPSDDVEAWVREIGRLYANLEYYDKAKKASLKRAGGFTLEKSLAAFDDAVGRRLGFRLLGR